MNCLNLGKKSLRTLRFDFELTVFNNTDEQSDDKVLLTHTLSQPMDNQFPHNREIEKSSMLFTAYP
jgi:hypothetical protein